MMETYPFLHLFVKIQLLLLLLLLLHHHHPGTFVLTSCNILFSSCVAEQGDKGIQDQHDLWSGSKSRLLTSQSYLLANYCFDLWML